MTTVFADEFRAGGMVWRREMIHFLRDRMSATVAMAQPLMFLYIMGLGLSRLFVDVSGQESAATGYLLFLFPGVMVMAAQGPAISVGTSIVWDRQAGFLREMLVAPVSRTTLLLGKCLGGASVAACQGLVVLASCGLIGVPYRPDLLVILMLELLLTSVVMTAIGCLVAVTVTRPRSFTTVVTVLITPMMFLAGMVCPVNSMPPWMATLTLVNPLTYAVDLMRRTLLVHLPDHSSSVMFTPITWSGHPVPPLVEVGVVLAAAAVILTIATHRFARQD